MERILIGDEAAPASEALIASGAHSDSEHLVPARDGRTTVAIITQPGPAARVARHARRVIAAGGFKAEVRVVPDRDAAKTLEVAEGCYLWLNELRLTRDDLIIGVGGGGVTDLAGFVAATYLRGIDVVHVPTTLLAAVDAAIGGKTGINVGGKNLVGVFHHPLRIIIDPDLLEGLPNDILLEGTAEALKTGLVGDLELVRLYEQDGIDAPLDEVITRAVRVKARVVSADFRELGQRAILNYGHTVGHGIELAGAMSHGYAVAVGMVAAGVASERVAGFSEAERQRQLISDLGLPTTAPTDLDPNAVRAYMALDKKRDASGLRMTLLEQLGSAKVASVDAATVEAALAAVGIT